MTNYETRIADVVAYDTNLRPHDMYRGQIIRIATGKVAYETKCYREQRTARLQAARYLKNFEHHLTKHGIGFEEQQEQKKAAERAEREAKRAAERRLRDAAPDMLAALLSAENAVAQLCEGQDERNQCWATLAQVRAAIDKATK